MTIFGETQRTAEGEFLKSQSDKGGGENVKSGGHTCKRVCASACVCKNMKAKGNWLKKREKNNRAESPARRVAGEKLKTNPKGGRWKSKQMSSCQTSPV